MMNIKYYLIGLSFLILTQVQAQQFSFGAGGRQAAMGYTSVAAIDLWSANNNQAALAFFPDGGGAGFYYQNSFLIKEMALNAGAVVLPTKSGTFALSLSNYGYSDFNTKKIGLAYGKKLGEKFSVGVQLDYLNQFIGDNYGTANRLTFEVGILAQIRKDLRLGAHVFNPIRVSFDPSKSEKIPLNMNLGLEWQASTKFIFALEAESNVEQALRIKAGMEYLINDFLYARMGMANQPNLFTFGAGIHLGNFRIDFASSMHQILGYSPQLSVVYTMDKD